MGRWWSCFSVFLLSTCVLSCFRRVLLFVILWTVACQAPLSKGFCRQDYWSGLPFHPPGDLPDLGIKPVSFASSALAGEFFTTDTTWEAPSLVLFYFMIMTQRLATKSLKSIYLNCGSMQGNLGFLSLSRHMPTYTNPQE